MTFAEVFLSKAQILKFPEKISEILPLIFSRPKSKLCHKNYVKKSYLY